MSILSREKIFLFPYHAFRPWKKMKSSYSCISAGETIRKRGKTRLSCLIRGIAKENQPPLLEDIKWNEKLGIRKMKYTQ